MFRLPAFFMALFICVSSPAQRTIKGRVVNNVTGSPVGGCSVFITNTSKGTTTDNSGNFILNDLPAGKHDLIISSIGYETNVFSFSDAELPLQLKIELRIKVKEMENVTLEPSVEEGWDKWGKTFMDNFAGTTGNASQCKIKNEKAIRFRYYKKSNRLTAYCDEPILLENKALGYVISYQLEDFEMNFKEGSVAYMGYSLFTETGKEGNTPKQKWIKGREKAYNGSIMHFMRSLYANKLLEEGFEVRKMQRLPNLEKERVRIAYSAARKTRKDSITGNMILEYALPGDSLNYYQQVMKQDNYKELIGADILNADSLIIFEKEGYKILGFDDYIYVTFKKELEDADYLVTQYPPRRATFQRSYVLLLGDKFISLDKSGNYYNPQHFLTSAYWGWDEKMSNSLPLDYEPGR
ncbi:MAG TPA: carboxypeptidase-like regulatory domain-containing protein [Chitinophagaceae bacterium]|jgi:hypothetical protein|nr:carboxypeptidase-like regulatory domain-containing protein [Chitinophagaceae bacterium]